MLCGVLMIPGLTGCVALNIPSERFHDAADDGGWLGGWHRPKRFGVPDLTPDHGSASPSGHSAEIVGGKILGVQPGGDVAEACFGEVTPVFDPSAEAADRQKNEIPWPRFHPVPTRPVFAPTDSPLPSR